ncbi:3705_t:CDS:2, partial [Cetraspora pellucida]
NLPKRSHQDYLKKIQRWKSAKNNRDKRNIETTTGHLPKKIMQGWNLFVAAVKLCQRRIISSDDVNEIRRLTLAFKDILSARSNAIASDENMLPLPFASG